MGTQLISLAKVCRTFKHIFSVHVIKNQRGNSESALLYAGLSSSEIRRICQFDLYQRTRELDGVMAECGVGNGSTLAFWSSLKMDFRDKRVLFAFDSFEGFPPTSSFDAGGEANLIKPKYKKYTREYVVSKLINLGIAKESISAIKFVKGWIPYCLEEYHRERFALVNIDLDLYQSTLDALQFFWPRLVSGGVILLDEYDFGEDLTKWPGAKKSIDFFCRENKIELKRHFTGRVYLYKS